MRRRSWLGFDVVSGLLPTGGGGVARPDGVHWHLERLSLHRGPLFPASIGANPQRSVGGIVNRLTRDLAVRPGARRPAPGQSLARSFAQSPAQRRSAMPAATPAKAA